MEKMDPSPWMTTMDPKKYEEIKNEIAEAVNEVMAAVSRMSWQEREELFDKLKCEYCIYCGDATPGRSRCHCMNDE